MAKTLLYGDEARLIKWASSITGTMYHPDAKTIGVVEGERIRGVAIYDNFSAANCYMHVASDGSKYWLSRDALVAFFAYPFIQCRLRRVTGWIAASNDAAQVLAISMGGQFEGRLQHALPDDDIVVYGITRDRCAFIPPAYRHV